MNFISEQIKRKNGRNHGEVFTHNKIVEYLLNEVNYKSDINLSDVKILEPASGTGSFAIEIIKRLYESSLKFGFSFSEVFESNVRFIELNEENFLKLAGQVKILFSTFGIEHDISNSKSLIKGDYLTIQFENNFNCIVGNPPYIRHELIDENLKKLYKSHYETFKYRADLYVLFFERSLQLLNENGTLSFICSNRWLYNQYGQILREKVARQYNLKKILNMEKASPFDENVLAYPSITTITNNVSQGETLFYETKSKTVDLDSIEFSKVQSPKGGSWQNLFIDYNLEHSSLTSIEKQNFIIGIGVATGADKIFIREETDVTEIERSRLLPIVTSRDLKDSGIEWRNKYLLNPYENGVLCNLEDYPNLKRYFNHYKEILISRHTARKNNLKWYKTIDNIKHDLLSMPKLLLPDFSGMKKLLIDEGNFYPHHSLYYIIGENIPKLKILACILMSDFIKEQVSQIGIRMNDGLPRFQAQTLKKLRIPIIKKFDEIDRNSLIEAYDNSNYELVNNIMTKYFEQHSL
ncbi:MAG: Eco57I restriction-modification methylase domain-containing protein [Bacteroidetes bacterium]|nr:Eco57I restriction-modification methylase domain-containing protein [Bacteroidota bacterium]